MSQIKHLNAINELFSSEEEYVKNLLIFSENIYNSFYKCIIISADEKKEIINKGFINIKNIADIHKTILYKLQKLKTEPNFLFEFYKAYAENIYLFEEYLIYANMLPQAQYILTEKITENEIIYDFSKEILNHNNATNLGFLHFLNNPLQKLTRYEILFQAIIKHEEDDIVRKCLVNIKKKIIAINVKINEIYKKSVLDFRIFNVYNNIIMPEGYPHKIIFNLESNLRIIFKEGEINVKFLSDYVPVKKYVFIFDHLILICDLSYKNKKISYLLNMILEPWSVTIIKSDETENYNSVSYRHIIKLENKIDGQVISLYFNDFNTKNIYLDALQKTINLCKNNFIDGVEIKKMFKISDNDIFNIIGSNIDYWLRIKDRDIKMLNNTGIKDKKEIIHENIFQYYKNSNFKSKILSDSFEANKKLIMDFINERNDYKEWDNLRYIEIYNNQFIFKNKIRFEKNIRNKKFMIFTDIKGIHIKTDTKLTCISRDITKKFIYNRSLNYILYLTDNKLKIAQISYKTTSLQSKIIDQKVIRFFHWKEKASYLFTVKIESGEERVFFNLIYVKNNALNIYRFGDLIIGEKINSIKLHENSFIIASKNFQIVSYNAVNARNFVINDKLVMNNMVLIQTNNFAREIFKISENLSLLCFDKSGHIFSCDGRTEFKSMIYRWGFEPTEFNVFERYLIVLGIKNVSIYDIISGVLLFTSTRKSYKFVFGMGGIYIHDSYFLYELILPKIK